MAEGQENPSPPQQERRKIRLPFFTKLKERAKQVMIDQKTGLPNSTYIRQTIEADLAEANRYPEDRAVRLVIADIDDFGQFNRIHGELFGDQVLRKIGQVMVNNVRDTDMVGRWGGEENVINMPTQITSGTTVEDQLRAVRRIREQVAMNAIQAPNGEAVHVTASIGTTAYKKGESFEEYFNRADKAMGIAKLLGKNCVVDARYTEQNLLQFLNANNQHVYETHFNPDHTGTLTDVTENKIYKIVLDANGKPKIEN